MEFWHNLAFDLMRLKPNKLPHFQKGLRAMTEPSRGAGGRGQGGKEKTRKLLSPVFLQSGRKPPNLFVEPPLFSLFPTKPLHSWMGSSPPLPARKPLCLFADPYPLCSVASLSPRQLFDLLKLSSGSYLQFLSKFYK